jgi:type I restriction enzyme S subunit
VFISEELAAELKNFECKADDVILVHKGSLGHIGIIPKRTKYPRYIMGNSMMRARLDPRKVLPKYFYYWLSSSDGYQYLMSRVSQVGVPQLQRPLSTLREAEFPVPPIADQEWIVRHLDTLDSKIELNRRTNSTLESMAQALFKEWFVDGVKEAWEEVPFARTVKVYVGGTPKTSVKEYWDGHIPWFAIADAGSDDVFVIDTERKVTQAGIDNSSAQIVPKGTTILTARGTVGQTVMTGVPMAMNQSCFGLWGIHDKSGYYTYFRARQLAEQFQQYSHGSVFSTINRSTFETLVTRMPDKDSIQRFEDIVSPMMECILTNIREALTLAALRDTLLPKLMRGEVRVGLKYA